MKKWALIISSFLLIVILFGCLAFHPRGIFLRKFYFALPMSAKIESRFYDLYSDCLEMKVRFESDDYRVILVGIERCGKIRRRQGKEFDERNEDYFLFKGNLPNSGEEFVAGYSAGELGLYGARTRTIKILITQDKINPDQYFLYVYY